MFIYISGEVGSFHVSSMALLDLPSQIETVEKKASSRRAQMAMKLKLVHLALGFTFPVRSSKTDGERKKEPL